MVIHSVKRDALLQEPVDRVDKQLSCSTSPDDDVVTLFAELFEALFRPWHHIPDTGVGTLTERAVEVNSYNHTPVSLGATY